ncbi:MAG: MFS transporter [Myxococcales bacterium]|nr:MFS transporter [Myxococcales bacterium]
MAGPLPDAPPAAPESADGKLTPYQKRLFVFLGVATFFEGYDFLALTQILPNLQADLGLGNDAAAYLVGVINVGTILAFWIVRRADIWGRRRTLTITIAGYTIATFLTGFAPDVYSFAVAQLIARIFLLGEWAISMVIAAEEFPASKRGMVIGVIQACSSLGSIFCAGVVPLLLKSEYGWRTVYFVGIVPLVILAFARRSLKETTRFEAHRAEGGEAGSLFRIWKTPYVKRLLLLALVWFIAYIPSQNAIAFWKVFAVNERGFTDGEVGLAISVAAVVAMPFLFFSGKLLDVIGRRHGAAVIFGVGAIGVSLCYTLESFWPLTFALMLGVFAASAYLPILNSYTAELFPTELRGMAFAWANNLLGRLGYVLSPLAIGLIVRESGAFGPIIASTAVFNLVAIGLVYATLPETKGRELEDTARLDTRP